MIPRRPPATLTAAMQHSPVPPVRPIRGLARWCGLVLGLSLGSTAGAETWYELEMVAFLRSADQVKTVEQPTPAQALVMPQQFWAFSLDGLTGDSSGLADGSVGVMGGSQLRSEPLNYLASAHSRLKRSSKYRVLFAAAWKQALGTKSLPIVLQTAEAAPGVYGLEGTLTLQHHRFLQANLNLGYSEFMQIRPLDVNEVTGTPADSISEQELQTNSIGPVIAEAIESHIRVSRDGTSKWQVDRSYRMAGEHRLKVSAVNYIDHPQIGVLLYAKPVDAPANVAEDPALPDYTEDEAADAATGELAD